MKEENEKLKKRLERALEYLNCLNHSDLLFTNIATKELTNILNGEEDV